MRLKARRDNNETEIREQLEALGFAVEPINSKAIPDLLCFHPTWGMWLVEVKSKGGKLTPSQVDFHQRFAGANIIIGRDIEQILKAMGVTS